MAKYNFSPGDVAEQVATALSILSGQPVSKDQVVVEPTEYAGRYLITVYETAAIATKVIRFLDEYGSIPTTLGELCTVGFRTNRKPCQMDLRQHGQIIGGTTSGKSSLIHVMLSHATRCTDCFIWIGGVWKLYDFVMSYVEPYAHVCPECGVKHRPPIDWIAHGQQDVCNMMAAFLRISKYRANIRLGNRSNLPYGILVLDEVTYITDDKHTRAIVDNRGLNASDMLAGIARGTAGTKLFEWLATQHDTMTNFGDQGSTTTSQMMFSFVFAIRDQGTVGRVLDDYSLPTPRKRGECWADMGLDNPIFKLRVPYPQSPDPEKPILHDGPRLDEIMWRRRHIEHTLDAGSAAAAGEDYANRFTMVDDAYLDYLTRELGSDTAVENTNVATSGGVLMNGGYLPDLSPAEEQNATEDWYQLVGKFRGNGNGNGNWQVSHDNGTVAIDDSDTDSEPMFNSPIEALAFLAEQGIIGPDGKINMDDESIRIMREARAIESGDGEQDGNDDVADMHIFRAKNGTRDNRVQAVIVTNDLAGGEPMTRGQIIEKLAEKFDDVVKNPQVVTNILLRLMGSDPPVIAKTADGRYYSL